MVGSRDRLVCGSRNNSDPSSPCMILWKPHPLGYERNLHSNYIRSWHGHRRRWPLHLRRRLLEPGLFVLPGVIVVPVFVHCWWMLEVASLADLQHRLCNNTARQCNAQGISSSFFWFEDCGGLWRIDYIFLLLFQYYRRPWSVAFDFSGVPLSLLGSISHE